MSKQVKLILLAIALFALGTGLNYYWQNFRGAGPAVLPPPQNISKEPVNSTGFPLELPPNFSIEIFARDLPGARVMDIAGAGMFVSQTSKGQISELLFGQDGKVRENRVWLKNLNKPHGLAMDASGLDFYFAEEDKITKVRLGSEGSLTKIADLPTQGGGHFTRTLAFGPDNRLYVSIGSSCNVCHEKDPRRAAIYSMNKDGSDFRAHATGLRNAVFFDWSYVDGRMWATEMGRDLLGDNLPPEEINIIEEGGNYGWPNCYGQNINDRDFDKNVYIQDPCRDKKAPHIEMQAHSAPLGLAFVPEEGWPEEYWYDLLVAFHGSWNRTTPTGYKIVRIKLDAKGNYEGTEDFITGWLAPEGALGRPVDILIQPGGVMYISDDKAGVIYKVTYQGT